MEKGDNLTEEQFNSCILRIKAKDRSGLKDLYDAYMEYIYRIVLGIVGRREDAEDITSEFFIKIYQTADSFKQGTAHKGYLATIARNMSIDFLRKHKREVLESFQKEDDEDEVFKEPISNDNTEKEVIEEISLKEALDKLNPAERQIVDMKVLSEMTFKEISEILGIPIGTVTWRYREAMNKLRRCGFDEKL